MERLTMERLTMEHHLHVEVLQQPWQEFPLLLSLCWVPELSASLNHQYHHYQHQLGCQYLQAVTCTWCWETLTQCNTYHFRRGCSGDTGYQRRWLKATYWFMGGARHSRISRGSTAVLSKNSYTFKLGSSSSLLSVGFSSRGIDGSGDLAFVSLWTLQYKSQYTIQIMNILCDTVEPRLMDTPQRRTPTM